MTAYNGQTSRLAPDVFVIDTPLQLLNAIEASAAYESADPHLLILHWSHWPRLSFESLLKRSRWSSITWLPWDIYRPQWRFAPKPVSDRLAEYIWVWRRALQRHALEAAFKRYRSPIGLLAIGNYCQPFMRHVLNTVPHERTIALDDGTDSLKAAEQRRAALSDASGPAQGAEGQHRSPVSLSALKAYINTRWIDMNHGHPISPVEFFSVYDLPPANATTLRHHAFEQLRSTLQHRSSGSQVLFLGQPLAEDGYLTVDDFRVLLLGVKSYYAGQDLIYVPHKRETSLSRGVAESLGLKIIEFDAPIEVVLATGQQRPRVLSSFFCSALENCRIIFGDLMQLEAVRIPDPMLIAAHEEVNRIYSYLEKYSSIKKIMTHV